MEALLFVVFRSAVVYLFIVFGIRIFGKKELSQLSVIDLVFILLISNAVQNAMIGENVSLQAGLVAALTLFIISYLLKGLLYRSKRFSEFMQGSPLMLIYHGKVLKEHLKKAQVSQDELKEAIREHGVESIRDVDLAVLEIDGNISVLSDEFKRKTSRRRKAHRVISKVI